MVNPVQQQEKDKVFRIAPQARSERYSPQTDKIISTLTITTKDPILALALLKTNWELHHKSYVDNFNVLTLECLRRLAQPVVSAHEVRDAIRRHFGLDLPLNTVVTLLKRAARQGILSREHGVYKVKSSCLVDPKLNEVQQRHLEAQEALVSDLARFACDRFSLAWSNGDAERAIHVYFADEAFAVLHATRTHSYVPVPEFGSKRDRYVLASYVNSVLDNESPHFEYLRLVAEGNIFAGAIFLADTSAHPDRKFRNTRIFFDTQFLLLALGHAGPSLQVPNTELLTLLQRSGAKLGCFVHTLDEMQSGLTAIARHLSGRSGSKGYGPVYDHYRCIGASESDVLLRVNRLDQDLEDFNIQIRNMPKLQAEHMISEKRLEETIANHLTYSNPSALTRDIKSIEGVIQLRGDSAPRFLETCGALFVTTNRPLVWAVQKFTESALPEQRITVAITDVEVTNIVWLKQPSAAPDLPQRRLIATCYAILQPSDNFLNRYLQGVDQLAEQGTFSERDVYMLKHSLEAHRLAMDLTVGDEEAFTTGTVSEVVELMNREIQREAQEKADEEGVRAASLRREIGAARERAADRRARRDQRAKHIAGIVAWVVASLISVVLAMILYLAIPLFQPGGLPEWVRVLASVGIGVLTLVNWTWGLSVVSVRERLRLVLVGYTVKLFACPGSRLVSFECSWTRHGTARQVMSGVES